MPSPFNALTAAELIAGFASGAFTPLEVAEAALARAREVQPAFNAFTLLDDESALNQARASTERWRTGRSCSLFDGVPVAVKDTATVKAWPTGFGSLSSRGARPAEDDAPLVQRLREHGAVFIGKTCAPEFAWKGITDSAASGITRNPWNLDKTPGGSSGGSAVAVALGVVPVATGADGGGSLRIPASFSGVLGLKPTAGLVPNLPTPLETMAVVGGLTRTVEDQARLLQAIVSPDARDVFAAPHQDKNYMADLDGDVTGLRIGLSADLGCGITDPEVERALLQSADMLRRRGAVVEPVTIDLGDLREAFETLWAVAFSEILLRLDERHRETVEPALSRLCDRVPTMTAWQVQSARRTARQVSTKVSALFGTCDLLLTPTVPILPFAAGELTPDPARFPQWWDWTPLTWPFNLSRHPAISCPAGLSASGLPIGVQLIAPLFEEQRLLRAASALEACTNHTNAQTGWAAL